MTLLIDWDKTNSVKIVTLGSITDLQENGIVSFEIPGYPISGLKAEAVRVTYNSDNDYIWSGKIINGTNGYISIITQPEGSIGFIQTEDRSYLLTPFAETFTLLTELDETRFVNLECGLDHTVASSPDFALCEEEYNTCPAIIYILNVVTPGARDWLYNTFGGTDWGAGLYLLLAGEITTWAFQNSDIPNKEIRSRTVFYDFEFDDVNGLIDIRNDIMQFGDDPDIRNLRNNYRADLVVMLTDRAYNFGSGRPVFGVADLGPRINNIFAIVEIPFIYGPRWSYAHEVGHLFGADHSVDQFPDGDCEHGLVFTGISGQPHSTILGTSGAINSGDLGARIFHYSNPQVTFDGVATGSATENNARQIRNAGCIVANFRANPELMVSISGSNTLCGLNQPSNTISKTYDAHVEAPATGTWYGNPPYTYSWHWNTSGIFNASDPGQYLGNSNQVTIDYLPACDFFFLQLKVTGSGNTIATYTKKITASICEVCLNAPQMFPNRNLSLTTTDAKTDLIIFPNPIHDRAIMEWIMAASERAVGKIPGYQWPSSSFSFRSNVGERKKPIFL